MSWSQKLKHWAAEHRRWMALALLGVFLSVFVLTLSEALHRALHADACASEHQCAVTMLQSGQVETPTTAVVPIVVATILVTWPARSEFSLASVDLSLPPSCGPPALNS